MRYVSHTVTVSYDKASEAALRDDVLALKAGQIVTEQIGGQDVVVKCDDSNKRWTFTGPCLVLDNADFSDIGAINAKLGGDLGQLQKDAKDGSAKAGEAVSLCYVVNNGGLRLAYGEAIKGCFRKSGGNLMQLGAALVWAQANNRTDLITGFAEEGGRQKLVDAYVARQT